MKTTNRHDIDDWLDNIDATTMRDATRLRAIGQALTEVERAEANLQHAIADAKDAGESWSAIALVLGTSRQAAHRKWAETINPSTTTAGLPFGPAIVGGQEVSRERRGAFGQVRMKREPSNGRGIPNSK